MKITPAMYTAIFAIAEAEDLAVTTVIERAVEHFMAKIAAQETTTEIAIAA